MWVLGLVHEPISSISALGHVEGASPGFAFIELGDAQEIRKLVIMAYFPKKILLNIVRQVVSYAPSNRYYLIHWCFEEHTRLTSHFLEIKFERCHITLKAHLAL
jgi:hypothetical protein